MKMFHMITTKHNYCLLEIVFFRLLLYSILNKAIDFSSYLYICCLASDLHGSVLS